MVLSNRAKNCLLLTLSICIALGISEVVLRLRNSRSIRVTERHKMPTFREYHPVYHHGLVPKASGYNTARDEFRVFYQINSMGMRDREYLPMKLLSTYRILALGDSFTEGYSSELNDSFIKQLEHKLNALPPKRGRKYEVANLGIAGFSPLLELLRFREFLHKLPGHFVLLNFDGSDFADDYFYEKGVIRDSDGTLMSVKHEGLLPPYPTYGRHFLESLPDSPWRNIYLFRYVIWHWIRRTHGAWVQKRLGDIEYDKYGWTRSNKNSELVWQEQVKRTFDYIVQIRDLAVENGMTFALSIHPTGHMIHPMAWCRGREKSYFACGKVYTGKLFENLLSRCQEESMTCWDLRPAFRRRDATTLFYDKDGHFTPAGNSLMATELEKRVRNILDRDK